MGKDGSSGTAGAAILDILDENDKVVATATGADVKGKKGSGQSAKVGIGGLDKTQNYRVRLTRTAVGGDVLVYAVKLYDTAMPTGISNLRSDVLTNGMQSGKVYNLRGQRVERMVKGQVYILDGKKFMAK